MQSICWTPVGWRWRLVSVSTMIGITTASLGMTQPATTRSPSSVKTLSLSWGKPETSAQTLFCETHRKWGDKLQDDNYCNTEWEKDWSWKHFWKIRAAETCMPQSAATWKELLQRILYSLSYTDTSPGIHFMSVHAKGFELHCDNLCTNLALKPSRGNRTHTYISNTCISSRSKNITSSV